MCDVVTAVRVVRSYVVEVTFEDGEKRVVDVQPFLRGPVFAPLRDPKLFSQVRVDPEIGSIVWPTGADLAPEFLYFGEEGPPPEYDDRGKGPDLQRAHHAKG